MPKWCSVLLCFALSVASALAQQSGGGLEAQDFAVARGLFRDGQYQLAHEEFLKFLEQHPSDPLAEEAAFLSAECLFNLGQVKPATGAYRAFIRQYPRSPLSNDARFRVGEALCDEGKNADALVAFRNVFAHHSPLSGEAAYWIGECHYRLGNRDSALIYYRLSYERFPGNRLTDFALHSEGWILEQQKFFGKAANAYRRLLSQAPQSTLAASARMRVGRCLFEDGKFRESIAYFGDSVGAITGLDERGEARFLIAESYYNLKEYPRALNAYDAFLKSYPQHRLERDARYAMAWVYLNEKNAAEAARRFAELATGNDHVAEAAAFRRGVALKEAGRREEARDAFELSASRKPAGDFADNALFELCLMRYEDHAYARAESLLDSVVRGFPASEMHAQALSLQGECRVAMANFAGAAEAFHAAAADTSLSSEARGNAALREGWSLHRAGNYKMAAARLTELVRRRPADAQMAEALYRLGEAEYQQGNYRQALASYARVLKEFPHSGFIPDALYGRGWSEYKLGDFVRSAETFGRLASEHRTSTFALDARLRQGDSYFARKDYRSAAGAYGAAAAAFPAAEGIDYALLHLAQSEVKAGAPSKGSAAYKDLIDRFPASPLADDARYGLGWIEFQAKRYREAIGQFKTLLERYPAGDQRATASYSIGDAYYNLGEYQKAVDAYRDVISGFPESPHVADAVTGIRYCYKMMGKEAEASRVLDELMGKHSGSPAAGQIAFKKGEPALSRGDYRSALTDYTRFIASYPTSGNIAEAQYKVALCLAALDSTDRAVALYEEVARRFPASTTAAPALLESGKLRAGKGQLNEARATFERIEKEYPAAIAAADAGYENGVLLQKSGQQDAALNKYLEVAERKDGGLASDRSRLAAGKIRILKGEYDAARSLFESVASRRTDETGAEAQHMIGTVLIRQKRYKEAITAMLRVKVSCPAAREWIARSYLAAGECYQQLNEKGKAREAYLSVSKSHGSEPLGREAQRKMKELQ